MTAKSSFMTFRMLLEFGRGRGGLKQFVNKSRSDLLTVVGIQWSVVRNDKSIITSPEGKSPEGKRVKSNLE